MLHRVYDEAFPELAEMIFRLDGKRSFFVIVCALLIAAETFACVGISIHAQSAEQDWEKAAGDKQQFEVASVRQNKNGGPSYSNFSLDNGNAYFVIDKNDKQDPNGTLFSAKNQTLIRYIIFAYKLSGTQELALRTDYWEGLKLHVPEWVKGDRYDIEARTPQPATKDQMRLMMQSLLAERFNLQVHMEPREVPIFALVLSKPGTLGPQLKPHPESNNCSATAFPDDSGKGATPAQSLSALPIPCGQISRLPPSAPGAHRFGGRNVTLPMLSTSMPAQTGMATVTRPVVDETGLTGGYDFWMDWTPEYTGEANSVETGGTFREALKNQLGLKLEPTKGPVRVLVIDHVEQPTAN
jgi:uncharacterized protein (TIGR03435 family)